MNVKLGTQLLQKIFNYSGTVHNAHRYARLEKRSTTEATASVREHVTTQISHRQYHGYITCAEFINGRLPSNLNE